MVAKRVSTVSVSKRTVHKIGGSLMISLPPEFIEAHGIKAGDELPVIANHLLKVVPMAEHGDDEIIEESKKEEE